VVARYPVDADGRVCLPVDDSAYAVARLRVVRGREERPPMQVHYRGGSDRRLLGIVRVEP
jgi:hypothetical protein